MENANPLRRAMVEENKCLFNGCYEVNLHRPSDFHKAMLLCKHNLYLPPNTNLCIHHMDTEEWSHAITTATIPTEVFDDELTQDVVNIFKSVLQHVQLTVSSALQ
jgi:hypothetical protein